MARKSHQDSAVRLVTAKRGPERATDDLSRPRVVQKEPPKLGGAICYGQKLATKSHQDSAVRFVTAKSWPERATKDSAVRFVTAKRGPERATKTRQYDLLRPRVGQKEPPCDLLRPRVGKKEPRRLGSTICCGQEFGHKKSHQDSAVRLVTAKSWPERATKTRQYDLLRPNVGQKEPPRLGSTSCYGQELARKSHQDSAVRFVTAKTWPHQDSAVRFVTAKSWPEGATKTRQYDLLRPRVGQKEPPRLGSTICYGQTWARKSHQSSAVRFVTAKRGPERAAKTRQYDLLRPRLGQKEPPRLGSTICCGLTWARKSHQDSDLIRPRVGQKKPPRLGSTICYGQTWARKSHQDSAVRCVASKSWPDKATKTRPYVLLRPIVGQKKPPRLGSTSCYGQMWARKSRQDSAIRFVTAKSWPERATKTRQYDLLRPNVGQKKPPRLGSTICYGQELARKSHQDSGVRFVTAKSGPERATKTRQYDLLRPRVGRNKPP